MIKASDVRTITRTKEEALRKRVDDALGALEGQIILSAERGWASLTTGWIDTPLGEQVAKRLEGNGYKVDINKREKFRYQHGAIMLTISW